MTTPPTPNYTKIGKKIIPFVDTCYRILQPIFSSTGDLVICSLMLQVLLIFIFSKIFHQNLYKFLITILKGINKPFFSHTGSLFMRQGTSFQSFGSLAQTYKHKRSTLIHKYRTYIFTLFLKRKPAKRNLVKSCRLWPPTY